MQTILINGKKRPVHFSTSAIIKLEELTGRPFYEYIFSLFPENAKGEDIDIGVRIIQKVGVGNAVKILYAGLYGGAKKAGDPIKYDEQDLVDELEDVDNLFEIIAQAVFMAFDSLPKPKDDEKKKAVKKQLQKVVVS